MYLQTNQKKQITTTIATKSVENEETKSYNFIAQWNIPDPNLWLTTKPSIWPSKNYTLLTAIATILLIVPTDCKLTLIVVSKQILNTWETLISDGYNTKYKIDR